MEHAFAPIRLSVSELACRRGGRMIFSGVSFDLGSGDALVVAGRNGAGKSTLLSILAGRLRPEAGTVRFSGAGEASLAESLHWIAHRDGLKTALTASENLAFAADVLGAPALDPISALERVGLPHVRDMPVAYLSAGQRRRVALARLVAARRPVWLLDEPTAALDVASQEMLRGLMADHRAQGGIVIAATHLPLGLEDARELVVAPPARAAAEPAEDFR